MVFAGRLARALEVSVRICFRVESEVGRRSSRLMEDQFGGRRFTVFCPQLNGMQMSSILAAGAGLDRWRAATDGVKRRRGKPRFYGSAKVSELGFCPGTQPTGQPGLRASGFFSRGDALRAGSGELHRLAQSRFACAQQFACRPKIS